MTRAGRRTRTSLGRRRGCVSAVLRRRDRARTLTPVPQFSFRGLLETLSNKTVVFVGDSINNLIFRASLCEAAKEMTVEDLRSFHSVSDPGVRLEMASKCVRQAMRRARGR